ncbi:MAG: hypothetical protein GY874_01390 [Desulfobacteraceae bacterium]|nr:hypothetical protein [Desulfobacteraceae bacterium]
MIDQRHGFTLIEVMFALCICISIAFLGYKTYTTQTEKYRNQRLIISSRQNLRGAMTILEQQIRMAGYDPHNSGKFGITDVRHYDLVKTNLNDSGQPALSFTLDVDEDGVYNNEENRRPNELFKFRIRKNKSYGRICLTWDKGQGGFPIAENIHGLGFAYAIDEDKDGFADTWAGGEHLIWAVDTDNDNLLDTNIDTNNDGKINENDDVNKDKNITAVDGGELERQVSPNCIKYVRVWFLSVTSQPEKGERQNRRLVVGQHLYDSNQGSLRREVLETTIACRNL